MIGVDSMKPTVLGEAFIKELPDAELTLSYPETNSISQVDMCQLMNDCMLNQLTVIWNGIVMPNLQVDIAKLSIEGRWAGAFHEEIGQISLKAKKPI